MDVFMNEALAMAQQALNASKVLLAAFSSVMRQSQELDELTQEFFSIRKARGH